MQEVVLEPLGMTRSCYGDLPSNEKNFAKAHCTGYTGADMEYRHFIEYAAAALWTTPTDLLKAVVAVQESLYTDTGFLKQETAKTMLTQVAKRHSTDYSALGWMVNDALFSHAGSNLPGFEAYFFGFHGGRVNSKETNGGQRPRNGFAVTTNSVLGFDVAIEQIISAVLYLKGWEGLKKLPLEDCVPYAAPEGTSVDVRWKDWIGNWNSNWKLVDEDGPALVFQSFTPMRLRFAAAPTDKLPDGKQEFIFVVDGLKTAVKLTWDGGTRIIELQQAEAKTLKRA